MSIHDVDQELDFWGETLEEASTSCERLGPKTLAVQMLLLAAGCSVCKKPPYRVPRDMQRPTKLERPYVRAAIRKYMEVVDEKSKL